jgi:hypothetical protein
MVLKDFYPTPENIISQMTLMFDLYNKNVLEPHAGTGNIVDYCNKLGSNVFFCEIEPKLQRTIKNAELIKPDFLKVESSDISHIDYIIMNPPFSADMKHILHAWEIAPAGCEIVSLCNSKTLGRYSGDEAKLRTIINDSGSFEYLGEVFKDAERQTNVKVSLVKLFKPAKEGEDEFSGYLDMSEEIENKQTGIIKHDWLAELVNRYIGAVKKFKEVSEMSAIVNELTKPFSRFNIKFGAYTNERSYQSEVSRNQFKRELQKAAWQTIFQKMNMDKYMNNDLMKELNKFINNNINTPFTIKNIYKIIDIIFKTHGGRMNRIILDIFDTITKHHSGNRYSVEGWKTNNQYFVGKKFILNYSGVENSMGHPTAYSREQGHVLDDFTKALCHLAGKNYDDFESLNQFFWRKEIKVNFGEPRKFEPYKEWGKWLDYGFFNIKVYKKGTAHCKFKDDKVWELFNITVSKAKGWRLPTRTGSDFRRKKDGVEII